MAWTVEISDVAERQLRRLDPPVRQRLLDYLWERIEGCKDPRHFGESLQGDKAGWWRYRVGDYRILCDIREERLLVLVIAVGHRRDVYG